MASWYVFATIVFFGALVLMILVAMKGPRKKRWRTLVWEIAVAMTGLAAGLVFLGIENQRSDRDQALENTRFVRQISLDGPCPLPLRGLLLARMSLAGLDLSGADMNDSDLSGADLTNAILVGASLEGADLTNARLVGADLRKANLARADFSGADLRGTKLAEARLTDTDMLADHGPSPSELEGVNWNPDYPSPRFPSDLASPENAWTEEHRRWIRTCPQPTGERP